jgi:hypothetical protein
MSLSLDEYRCKVINEILFAGSREEVKRFCGAAIKGLEEHKVHGHFILRFIDKVISELEKFSPMNKDAQQWSNITMARIYFNRVKHQLNAISV